MWKAIILKQQRHILRNNRNKQKLIITIILSLLLKGNGIIIIIIINDDSNNNYDRDELMSPRASSNYEACVEISNIYNQGIIVLAIPTVIQLTYGTHLMEIMTPTIT